MYCTHLDPKNQDLFCFFLLRFCDFLFYYRTYAIFIQKCTNNVRTVNFLPRFSTPLMLKIKVPATFAHSSHSEP
nr:MAG TPA: hypothetical protein [Caudoviricetes sp.]